MWQTARMPNGKVKLVCNALELSETWPSRIDGIQLQNLKKTNMIGDDKCAQFRDLWMSLLMEEKTRQRVAKPESYDFLEHDNLKLPWKFDVAKGVKAMPVIIWMKKELVEAKDEVRYGSSSSGWSNWHGVNWWSQ